MRTSTAATTRAAHRARHVTDWRHGASWHRASSPSAVALQIPDHACAVRSRPKNSANISRFTACESGSSSNPSMLRSVPNNRRIPGPLGPAVSRDTGDADHADRATRVVPVGRDRLAARCMEEVHDERVALAFGAVVPLVHFFDLHELILSASAGASEAADQPKHAPSPVPSRHG